jgi:hypothetical protein
MKKRFLVGCLICLSVSALRAQDFGQQLQQMKESFEKAQREMREAFEKVVQDQQGQINQLKRQLGIPAGANAGLTNAAPGTAQQPMATQTAGIPPQNAAQPWRPSDPIRLYGGAQNYINVSFDGLFAAGTSTAKDVEALQLGGHDPKQRGFTVQNLETTFEGKVDPYFRGQANIVMQLDPEGETTIEAEEAYLETMALPWNLQLKAGQYFTEFGRLNPTHPHTWDFVDQPLVNGRFLGGDGLRNPGARLSWLAPTPFYSEFFFSVQNSQGETASSFRDSHEDEMYLGRFHEQGRVKSFNDLLFTPRYAASFELSDEQTILLGTSAAFGPNGSGQDSDTQIYGVDLFYKWKPVNHHAGFPFVTWQTEAMYRRYEAGRFVGDVDGDDVADVVPREVLCDWGVYSQLSYGFHKGWVASLRGDFVMPTERGKYEKMFGFDSDRDTRWRLSPALTWYPTEFSKIRLQYNYDHSKHGGSDHSIWIQWEFLLGSHAAHKF